MFYVNRPSKNRVIKLILYNSVNNPKVNKLIIKKKKRLLSCLNRDWIVLHSVAMHRRIDYFPTLIGYCTLYSNSSNRVYCFACKLFGEARVADTRLVVGYNNWQCHSKILKHHETSGYHKNAYLMWKELASRLCLAKIANCREPVD